MSDEGEGEATSTASEYGAVRRADKYGHAPYSAPATSAPIQPAGRGRGTESGANRAKAVED
jgi:hypothetical protein